MYSCPMHPSVASESPGLCPECGMKLIEVVDSSADHNQHSSHKTQGAMSHMGHAPNIFKQRFWVSLVLAVPIVLYAPITEQTFGNILPHFSGYQWVSVVLGSIVFLYGGWIFIISAYRELRSKAPGMMTLISLAIITAYIFSFAQVLLGRSDTLFWELATLIVVMLLGHWMEMRAVQGAQGALREISKLLPDEAEVVHDGNTHTVPLVQLLVGNIVMIRPGGKVPVDGEVTEGSSDVNEALITGESKPIAKTVGDKVIAGTINGNGSLMVRVSHIGDNTFLAGIVRLIQQAQASKSKLQLVSDRAALYLTGIAIVAALITVAVWTPLRGIDFGLTRMVAVLVIACPHALGLAIPLVASISTSMAAQNGFLVRKRLDLEVARSIDVVLFDKTGTLTTGEYEVTGIKAVPGTDEQELLRLAASVDAKSEHAVSSAIVKKAGNIVLSPVENFKRLPGRGVSGTVAGKNIAVGGQALLSKSDFIAADMNTYIEKEGEKGQTVVYVLADKSLLGVISLGDHIRSESYEAIKSLKEKGVEVAMVTGDAKSVATWVASELGIKQYFAHVLPEGKAQTVKQLQAEGKKVAMVGDGINDAPALTQADVGIAIGAGTNVAVESAGIVLVKNDPRDISRIITLSRLTYTKMIQNLWWAAGYNIIALPLAAGIAAAWGIFLNPAISALFMSISTVIVAVNAVLLRRHRAALQ